MIVAPLITILRTAKSSENSLASVDMTEEDEVVGRSTTKSVSS